MFQWLKTLLSGRPHFYIGGTERPYMLRWFLLPRNRWCNVYLHKFCRDDDDRAMHDHPWWFISIMLRGQYIEHHTGEVFPDARTIRYPGSVMLRPAAWRHRVELPKREDGSAIPCWTLIITGPKVREWGFWCPKGFVPWRQFVDVRDPGAIGPGCGDGE